MSKTLSLIPVEHIENKIYLIRGQKVMLDRDLAELYGVKTFVLNQAVKRNLRRFPTNFMFSLTRHEILRISQIVISSDNHDNISLKYSKNVNAFTEQGIAMLSGILKSDRAIAVNITIMRAFVKLRQVLATHKELAHKLEQLEQKVGQNSGDIRLIFEAIRKLMEPPPLPPTKPRRIGFIADRRGEELPPASRLKNKP
ncbi:MAG: ORF6N domain-containing protein [Candidatus Margulisiibacteriota bacterium]